MTKVSVVISCYNGERFLADAIESVLQQTISDKEIIVVNDGSTDNSREVALSFYDKIRYIEQENRGVSAARNAGIRSAEGTYIALLDQDDVLCENSLQLRIDYLEAHPDVWLVCGEAIYFNENGDLILRSEVKGKPQNLENFRWETVEYVALPSTTMVRCEAFEIAGFFDERIKIGAEDWLLWAKFSRHFNMAYLPRPIARVRRHEHNATRDSKKMNATSRYAVRLLVEESLSDYPADYQAKLLYRRAATAWRVESPRVTAQYLWQALKTDPKQIWFGWKVFREGIDNSIDRYFQRR